LDIKRLHDLNKNPTGGTRIQFILLKSRNIRGCIELVTLLLANYVVQNQAWINGEFLMQAIYCVAFFACFQRCGKKTGSYLDSPIFKKRINLTD
jgi:hypothetical protein